MSGPSPRRSITPGRKGSIRTSEDVINFFKTSRPLRVLGLIASDRLFLHNISGEEDENGLSIRMTVAPLSANIRPAKGPGARPAN